MDFKGLSVPKWDGKDESAPMYLEKLEALAEVYDIGDTLDEAVVVALPTKAENGAHNNTSNHNSAMRNIFSANKRFSAICTLDQDSQHGLAVLRKTK